MFKRTLRKPDGRRLILFGRAPLADDIVATGPARADVAPNSHLRWHPLRGEWVAYAAHRQHRAFLPPAHFNPLAPGDDPAHPTEVPRGAWDIAVFDNLSPTFVETAHDPPNAFVDTLPARGACEVVVFTQDPATSLGALSVEHIALLFEVWADRTADLGARDDVKYVFPFENRGVEVGVTLLHPHGQVYAYPFVPPLAARELEQQRAYYETHGRGLLEAHIECELRDALRMLYEGPRAVAFVPVCARYPYEVWVAPRLPLPSLVDLDADTRDDLARALKTVLMKFDALWQTPFPYIMALHQSPTDGVPHPEAHVHLQLYPAYRMPGRLKYLAGSEIGAGVFTADTLPEQKAAELRAVEVSL